MSFNSLAFLLFLGAVVALYYLLPVKARNPLLLAASYFFYMVYSVPLALFLVLCTLGTWAVGLKVQTSAPERKKAWLTAGVVVNIGVLAFYKYLNFMFSSVNSMLGGAGVEARLPRVDLIAPLGISFVIFQAVSYLVDVAREKIPAEKSLYYFALYLAFFPKVVQGPITKYGDVRPQFDEVHRFDWVNFRTGAMMAFYGLFMKMVVADRAAVVVNTLYASPEVYSGAALTLATVLFSLQIYFDFAGYSLTAIGSARMLGFFLKENFHQPYLSASVGEFWRRWHMSLNKWLTDYIYIPLGGSRCAPARRDMNTLVTFGLSGLWHGANWGYVIWGLLNGVYIVVEKRISGFNKARRARKGLEEDTPAGPVRRFVGSVVTFVLVAFTWIFFRAQTLSASLAIIRRILFHFDLNGFLSWVRTSLTAEEPALYGLSLTSWVVLALFLAIAWAIDIVAQKGGLAEKVANASLPVRWAAFMLLFFVIIIFGMYGYGYSAGAFIYANF